MAIALQKENWGNQRLVFNNGSLSHCLLISLSLPTRKPTNILIHKSFSIQTESIIPLLKSCSNISEFSLIHAHLITTNLIHDPLIASHVFGIFISNENLNYAQRSFSQTHDSETVIWNTLIESQLKNGSSGEVFSTYCHMVTRGVLLDASTFHFLIHACSNASTFRQGSEVHGRILKSGFGVNRSLNNNLMGLYSKVGSWKKYTNCLRNFLIEMWLVGISWYHAMFITECLARLWVCSGKWRSIV